MVFQPLIAFTGAALEPGAIEYAHCTPARSDEPVAREFLDDRVDGRPLHPQEAGKRLLCQLNLVTGTALHVEQPARGALCDRVESVACDGLHHRREKVIR